MFLINSIGEIDASTGEKQAVAMDGATTTTDDDEIAGDATHMDLGHDNLPDFSEFTTNQDFDEDGEWEELEIADIEDAMHEESTGEKVIVHQLYVQITTLMNSFSHTNKIDLDKTFVRGGIARNDEISHGLNCIPFYSPHISTGSRRAGLKRSQTGNPWRTVAQLKKRAPRLCWWIHIVSVASDEP